MFSVIHPLKWIIIMNYSVFCVNVLNVVSILIRILYLLSESRREQGNEMKNE